MLHLVTNFTCYGSLLKPFEQSLLFVIQFLIYFAAFDDEKTFLYHVVSQINPLVMTHCLSRYFYTNSGFYQCSLVFEA